MQKILVSTVTPVYRGAATLRELVARLSEVRERWAREDLPLDLTEAIFVDDGSVDDSSAVLESLAGEHSWVKVVTLSRNFGQHPATIAGILHTCGDWVVTLDEDLQHRPAFILPLLKKAVDESLDVVYAAPAAAVHRSLVRDGGSRLGKALLAFATRNPHIRDFNSFRLIRGAIARAAAAVASHDTYFDVELGWFSRRLGTLALALEDRRYVEHGTSGYSFSKLVAHARRLLISAQTRWLSLGAVFGLLALVLSSAAIVVVFIVKLLYPESIAVRGWTSLFLLILFFGGLGAFLQGVLLEHLSTVVFESQGKPTFFVVERETDRRLRDYFARQG